MPKRSANLLPYLGAGLSVLALAWSLTSGWFSLEKRVTLLEQEQRFSHGDVRPFLQEK